MDVKKPGTERSVATQLPEELVTNLGRFRVQKESCATCIYRTDSPLDIEGLEAKVRDEHDGFNGYRICHHSDDACCRGFWNRYKDEFAAGQIAQRFGLVELVSDDNWPRQDNDDDA